MFSTPGHLDDMGVASIVCYTGGVLGYVSLFFYLLTSPSQRPLKYIMCSQMVTISLVCLFLFSYSDPLRNEYVCEHYVYRMTVIDILETLFCAYGSICICIHAYNLFRFFYDGVFDIRTTAMLMSLQVMMIQFFYITQSDNTLTCDFSTDRWSALTYGIYSILSGVVVHDLALVRHANIHLRCGKQTAGAFLLFFSFLLLSIFLSNRDRFPDNYATVRNISGRGLILGALLAFTSFAGIPEDKNMLELLAD
uniref:Protein E28 n=1 Tax=Elephant endotheliotropic herpesvirus 1A TaxID=759753 RepID=A0A866VTF4_ELHV1|nr:protein E28 [Elephant endotheliotropic herpesvirus 1A]